MLDFVIRQYTIAIYMNYYFDSYVFAEFFMIGPYEKYEIIDERNDLTNLHNNN